MKWKPHYSCVCGYWLDFIENDVKGIFLVFLFSFNHKWCELVYIYMTKLWHFQLIIPVKSDGDKIITKNSGFLFTINLVCNCLTTFHSSDILIKFLFKVSVNSLNPRWMKLEPCTNSMYALICYKLLVKYWH